MQKLDYWSVVKGNKNVFMVLYCYVLHVITQIIFLSCDFPYAKITPGFAMLKLVFAKCQRHLDIIKQITHSIPTLSVNRHDILTAIQLFCKVKKNDEILRNAIYSK